MSPRVPIGLLISFAILGIVVLGLRLPDRLLGLDGGNAPNGGESARRGYAADGYNAVMEQAGRAVTQGDFETAVELFLQVPSGGDPRAVRARMYAGQFLITELHEPTRGLAVLSELLAMFPEQIEAHALMAQTLDAVGRKFEADEHYREFVRVNERAHNELFRLAEDRVGVGNTDMLKELHHRNPEDLNVRLGMGLLAIAEGRLGDAEQTLRQVATLDPQLWTVQAGLATALLLQDKFADYDAWRAALPAGAETSSEIWLARGQAAERREQPEIAARCFVEAVRIDPDNLEANQGAARLLTAMQRSVDAAYFVTRAAQLAELAELVRIDPGMTDPQHLDRAAQLTESLGRLWESRGWTYHLASTDRNNPAHQRRLKHLQQMLDPLIIDKLRTEANPANHVDVSALPVK